MFPLASGKKLPAVKEFYAVATRDAGRIAQWWPPAELGFAEPNIGISTTRYGDDDTALLVIDVDNKHDKHGDVELARIRADPDTPLPDTLEQRTPTGGRHLIYTVDAPVRQGVDVLGPGLDIRAHHGFIVGAGSRVEAGTYTIGSGVPVPAPQWLVLRCGTPGTRAHDVELSAERLAAVDTEAARTRAIAYLTGFAPESVRGAGGDQTAYRVAAMVKDFGVPEADCLELMLEHWYGGCGWSPAKLSVKIHNAYSYGMNPPGAADPALQFIAAAWDGDDEPPATGCGSEPPEVAADSLFDPAEAPIYEHSDDIMEVFNSAFSLVITGQDQEVLYDYIDSNGTHIQKCLSPSSFARLTVTHRIFVDAKNARGEATRKIVQASNVWLNDARRRLYMGYEFLPLPPAPRDDAPKLDRRQYNLWSGFRYAPSPTPADRTQCWALNAWLEHIEQNVCGGDPVLAQWLIGYFAHSIQRPWEKPIVALVFQGEKGVGKNAAVERVADLFGRHTTSLSNRKHLLGQFNAHFERCCWLLVEEAFWSGDRESDGILKNIISKREVLLEPKGRDAYNVTSRFRVAIMGNEEWQVPASNDERRYAVFKVGTGRKQDRGWFKRMREDMEAGDYAVLLRYLLDYDLSSIDVNAAPKTDGLREQKELSLDLFGQWWLNSLHEGTLLGGPFRGGWPESVLRDDVRTAFGAWAKGRHVNARLPDERAIGRHLRAYCPSIKTARQKPSIDPRRPYLYAMPPLEVARQEWDAHVGHASPWDDGSDCGNEGAE